MSSPSWSKMRRRSGWSVATAGTAGLAVAVVVGVLWGWTYAPVLGWIAASALYLVLTWATIARLGSADTAAHAGREDPGRRVSRVILFGACLASVGGVALFQVTDAARGDSAALLSAVLAIVSLVVSWFTLHTLFVLRYAELYYAEPAGGVDFGDEQPAYRDFAYLAFTVGMTYQVADTTLKTGAFRAAVLQQAFLAFLFVSIILATTVNLFAGLR